VAHLDPAGVARDALGRLRGNVRAAFDDGLAGRLGVGEWSPCRDAPFVLSALRRVRVRESFGVDAPGHVGRFVR